MCRSAVMWAMAVLLAGLVMSAPGTVAAAVNPQSPEDGSPSAAWQDDSQQSHDASSVQLTDQQKKKLAKLYDRLYKDHEALIQLYAEYGLITEEQKARKLEWLKKRHERIKANGYRPCPEKHWKRHEERSTEPNVHSETHTEP